MTNLSTSWNVEESIPNQCLLVPNMGGVRGPKSGQNMTHSLKEKIAEDGKKVDQGERGKEDDAVKICNVSGPDFVPHRKADQRLSFKSNLGISPYPEVPSPALPPAVRMNTKHPVIR